MQSHEVDYQEFDSWVHVVQMKSFSHMNCKILCSAQIECPICKEASTATVQSKFVSTDVCTSGILENFATLSLDCGCPKLLFCINCCSAMKYQAVQSLNMFSHHDAHRLIDVHKADDFDFKIKAFVR
jgi:hypothetical protein